MTDSIRKASEVREVTNQAIDEKHDEIITEIGKLINEAAANGEYQVVYTRTINKDIEKTLKSLGYHVANKSHNETIICW